MTALLKKLDTVWAVLAAIAILAAVYLAVLLPWLNRWGATDAEVSMKLPGDGVQPGLMIASTRAVTVQAPAAEVWQWVVQIGQDQAGFYSNDWLENLVFSDIHNQDRVHPEWQSHQQGDHILGAGGAVYGNIQFWPTRAYEEGKMLYLWGPIVVIPVDAHTSRLLARSYAEPSTLVTQLTYDWMHFVMERGMLLGIQARAEGRPTVSPVLDLIAKAGWIATLLGIGAILFRRRQGWAWGLIPLAYGLAILVFTRDAWSAMAGFLWFGVIAAGFLLFGRAWWRRLALATALVVLTFVLNSQPHIAFGLIFLIITAGCAALRMHSKSRTVNAPELLRA